MGKQSEALLEYLRSGRDRRSPSLINMRKHSGYADNRALIDGLRRLMRIGQVEKTETGYWARHEQVRDFSAFRYHSGGTS